MQATTMQMTSMEAMHTALNPDTPMECPIYLRINITQILRIGPGHAPPNRITCCARKTLRMQEQKIQQAQTLKPDERELNQISLGM